MEVVEVQQSGRWNVPSLEQQVEIVERHGLEGLHYCKDLWAVRHQWLNRETGEVQRARCNRWECSYCGPRKVNLWRELVRQAEPVLFLTLSKAGKTVEEARRAFTTFIQALRRGSKGKGKDHIGARLAYLVEYFAVLERHKDFERNGFHWHILIKGVDAIPYKEVIQPLWMSATHYRPASEEEEGRGAKIGDIRRIRNSRAIGYVTKYLTKALNTGERGVKEVQREHVVLVQDENGHHHTEKQIVTEQVTSRAHRICYSRQFFPERVADLRKRLFAGVEAEAVEQADNSKPLEVGVSEQRSPWVLIERAVEGVNAQQYKQHCYAEVAEELEGMREAQPEAYAQHKQEVKAQIVYESRVLVLEEYRQLKRRVLIEALEEDRPLSRRVISIWDYQRKQLRLSG